MTRSSRRPDASGKPPEAREGLHGTRARRGEEQGVDDDGIEMVQQPMEQFREIVPFERVCTFRYVQHFNAGTMYINSEELI